MLDEKFFRLVVAGCGESRVGGAAPDAILGSEIMANGGKFLLTLAGRDFKKLAGKDLSIAIRADFLPTDSDTVYPNMGIECFLHAPCMRRTRDATALDAIAHGALVPGPCDGSWFIKYGGRPRLLQQERHYEEALLADGYEFIFQLDEGGYPDGFVVQDYPFNFGALFVYGRRDASGCITETVAGFTQF